VWVRSLPPPYSPLPPSFPPPSFLRASISVAARAHHRQAPRVYPCVRCCAGEQQAGDNTMRPTRGRDKIGGPKPLCAENACWDPRLFCTQPAVCVYGSAPLPSPPLPAPPPPALIVIIRMDDEPSTPPLPFISGRAIRDTSPGRSHFLPDSCSALFLCTLPRASPMGFGNPFLIRLAAHGTVTTTKIGRVSSPE